MTANEELDELARERDEIKAELTAKNDEYLFAAELVAQMHEAAMGGVFEPVLGVVEDVENVRKQLTEREKQIVMLRKALQQVVDIKAFRVTTRLCEEALAATKDLSGYILCDAKPAMRVEKNASSQIRAVDVDGNAFDLLTNVGVTFYKAKD
jgi:chromosome segregation ATPase